MDSYYSYVKEENDDDSIFYTFSTQNNLLYTVYFDAYEYQNKLENYPTLLQNGWAFGFKKKDFAPSTKKSQDEFIFPTIFQIMNDFISEYGNDAVLLYHCDSKDEKHPVRDRLFGKWKAWLIKMKN